MIHRNILAFGKGRYFWAALGLIAASVAIFATQTRYVGWNGGTWQGYVLGTVGALLIVWLALLGIRKRSYRSGLGSVQGWTSAHVYLGTALLVVATLHCAGQFGWNLHTVAYVLMSGVIGSGFFGIYMYMTNPRAISDAHAGRSRAELFAEIYKLDAEGRELARKCESSVGVAVKSSIERTVIGGGVLDQLTGRDRSLFEEEGQSGAPRLSRNVDQQAVIDFVASRIPRAEKGIEAPHLAALVAVLCRRQSLLRRIRRDIRLQGWLKIWLYVHIPLTVALLLALTLHILVTFIYW